MAVQSFRRNRRIRVPEVRLIDENGDQAGVVSTKDALQRAQEAGLDLVEVAPTARPPVCKILDWGKFNYEQSKKNKRDKAVFTHVTCATDTGNIQFVLNAVNMIFRAKDMAAQGI